MIDSFKGEYRFLSNFWYATVEYEQEQYRTVEHAYVAAKTLDKLNRTQIRFMESPAQVKAFGRTLVLRPDWEEIKLDIMGNLVYQKFHRHANLKKLLLGTGDQELIEGNTWGDTYWGVCEGVGENHLGKILMDVRDGLHKQTTRT